MPQSPLLDLEYCPSCKGSTRRVLHEMRYDFGDVLVVVENVPVIVCDGCDEVYVPGVIGVHLSELVAQAAASARVIMSEHQGGESPAKTVISMPEGRGTLVPI